MEVLLIEEGGICEQLDRKIRGMLSLCFERHKDELSDTRDPLGDNFAYRAVLLDDGIVAAHTAVVERRITVGSEDYNAAGVGFVGVQPDYRGRRLSKDVLEPAMDYARQRGSDFGLLFTSVKLRKVYERAGFSVISRRPIWHTENGRVESLESDFHIQMFCPCVLGDFPAGTVNLNGRKW